MLWISLVLVKIECFDLSALLRGGTKLKQIEKTTAGIFEESEHLPDEVVSMLAVQ